MILGGFFMPNNSWGAPNLNQETYRVFEITDYNIKPGPIKKRLKKLYLKLAQSDKPRHKLALSALTITLGVFGAHRIYLGTEPHVPVLYAVTLGGGLGIVPLVDLIHILASKDPLVYSDDSRFFMWGQKND